MTFLRSGIASGQSTEYRRFFVLRSSKEFIADALSAIELNKSKPLVVKSGEPCDSGAFFDFFSRDCGYRHVYDLHCISESNALEWIAHISEKSWVTKDHLRIFSTMASNHFGCRHA